MPTEDQIVGQSATVNTKETQQPAEVINSVEGAETANPEVTPESTPEAQPESHEPPKWAQRRIDQLTREKHEERRQREVLEARLAQVAPPADTSTPTLTQADVDARATQIANERVKQTQFDDACNKAYEQGKTEFKDFDQALGNFAMLGGLPKEFLDIATKIPEGHKVLYALGKNPEEASRILALPALDMALEVARLSEKVAKPSAKPVSSAPAPIEPIDGTARVESDPDKMSTAEWMRWRNENRRKSN